MSLIYEIADDYLPDKMVNGMDCPDIGLAEEIVCRIVDKALESIDSVSVFQKYVVQPTDSMEPTDFVTKSSIIRELQALKEGG